MQFLGLLIKPVSGCCNMDCTYCFYKELVGEEAKITVMNEEITEQLIEKAFESEAATILFAFQGGEPLMAGLEFFEKFVNKVETKKTNQKIHYSVQTNGLLLNKAFRDFLIRHHFLVGLSLDGPKYIHDKFRIDYRRNGTFFKVFENALAFQKEGGSINILFVITSEAATRAEKIYSFFKKHHFQYLQFIPCMDSIYEIQGETDTSLKNKEYVRFLKALFNLWEEDFMNGEYISIRHFDNWIRMLMGEPSDTCALSGQCGSYFVIERDGSVYPCDFYVAKEWKIGNITMMNFMELENALIESGFLSDYQQKRDKECLQCRNQDLCRGGCKRDWVLSEYGGKTRYCEAYQEFFDFACPKMIKIAQKMLKMYL